MKARPDMRSVRIHLLFIAGLLVLALGVWWHVWIDGHPTSTISCQCGDPALYLWFVQWVPWSIGHLHNPLLTNAIYSGQGGANTLDTNVLLPPLLVSPITAVFGPIAAFNVLVVLVPVVNGWAMFFFLRKVTGFLPGQVIAATFWGFSPTVDSHLPFGHFNADFLFFPPLVLWCLHDLLIARKHSPLRIGLTLGALVIVQFFTGPELLAMTALIGAFCIVGLLLVAPRLVVERVRPIATAVGAAATLSVVALGYPAWFLAFGPRHTVGYPWSNTPSIENALNAIVAPGLYRAPSIFDQIGGYFGARGPSAAYLGYGLLGLLALSVIVWWPRRFAWCLVGLGIVGWALGLGVGVGPSDGWFPWRFFTHVPLVSEILPERFALFTDLAAAGLLAVSLDQWWSKRDRVLAAVARRRQTARDHLHLVYGAALSAAAIGVLVPIGITYNVPYAVRADPIPSWFRDVAPRLSPGTVLLTVPYPASAEPQAMAWQADADFDFAMVGGYALVPGRDGRHSIYFDPPDGAPALLDALSFGISPEPAGSLHQTIELRQALRTWGVQVVVVAPNQGRDPRYAVAFLTATLGRAPLWQDGSWVWYGLGSDPPLGMSPLELDNCTSGTQVNPESTSSCVLGGPNRSN